MKAVSASSLIEESEVALQQEALSSLKVIEAKQYDTELEPLGGVDCGDRSSLDNGKTAPLLGNVGSSSPVQQVLQYFVAVGLAPPSDRLVVLCPALASARGRYSLPFAGPLVVMALYIHYCFSLVYGTLRSGDQSHLPAIILAFFNVLSVLWGYHFLVTRDHFWKVLSYANAMCDKRALVGVRAAFRRLGVFFCVFIPVHVALSLSQAPLLNDSSDFNAHQLDAYGALLGKPFANAFLMIVLAVINPLGIALSASCALCPLLVVLLHNCNVHDLAVRITSLRYTVEETIHEHRKITSLISWSSKELQYALIIGPAFIAFNLVYALVAVVTVTKDTPVRDALTDLYTFLATGAVILIYVLILSRIHSSFSGLLELSVHTDFPHYTPEQKVQLLQFLAAADSYTGWSIAGVIVTQGLAQQFVSAMFSVLVFVVQRVASS